MGLTPHGWCQVSFSKRHLEGQTHISCKAPFSIAVEAQYFVKLSGRAFFSTALLSPVKYHLNRAVSAFRFEKSLGTTSPH
jgi:hypothetical protein